MLSSERDEIKSTAFLNKFLKVPDGKIEPVREPFQKGKKA